MPIEKLHLHTLPIFIFVLKILHPFYITVLLSLSWIQYTSDIQLPLKNLSIISLLSHSFWYTIHWLYCASACVRRKRASESERTWKKGEKIRRRKRRHSSPTSYFCFIAKTELTKRASKRIQFFRELCYLQHNLPPDSTYHIFHILH